MSEDPFARVVDSTRAADHQRSSLKRARDRHPPSTADELTRLPELHQTDVLSDDEFSVAKARLQALRSALRLRALDCSA